MITVSRLTLRGGLLFCCISASATATEFDALAEQIAKTWQEHKTLTARVKRVQPRSEKDNVERFSECSREVMRDGDKMLSREDCENYEVKFREGIERKTEIQRSVHIHDGEHSYSYTLGTDAAGKWPHAQDNPRKEFETLRRDYELTLMPAEVIGAEKTIVIEANPRPDLSCGAKVILYYRRDGVLLKKINLTEGGEPWTPIEFTNIQFDVDVDPQQFIFTPPEGVEVRELKSGEVLSTKRLTPRDP